MARGLVILHGAGVLVLSTDDASQDASSGFPSPIRYSMPAFRGECLSYPSGYLTHGFYLDIRVEHNPLPSVQGGISVFPRQLTPLYPPLLS